MVKELTKQSGYKKILVAIDFSPHSDAALNQAAWLAQKCGAKVVLAHSILDIREAFIETSYEGRLDFLFGTGESFQRELRLQADTRMQQKIVALDAKDLDITCETLLGAPFLGITHAVQAEGHDLVIAGTRGMAAWKALFVGSTAKRLIRKCPASVWIVKADHAEQPKVVLAATDLSEVSFKAAMQGLWVAKQANAEFHLLHVVDMSLLPRELHTMIPHGEPLKDYSENSRKRLDAFAKSLPTDDVKTQVHFSSGVPWEEVGRMAHELKADLIAMGTVGRSGIKGLLLGNTAEKILDTCDCSILTVKPEGFVSPIDPAFWSLHPDVKGNKP